WPLVCEQQRLPRKVFRRSIAGLPGSLPTLRRVGYPDPTQDSLPAVGQTLLDGLLTRRVPTKGFRGVLVTSLPPFPSLLGAITSTAGCRTDASKVNRPPPARGASRAAGAWRGPGRPALPAGAPPPATPP